jgi:hypothetical protein
VRKLLVGLFVVVAGPAGLATPSGAVAATTVGNDCVGSVSASNATFVQIAAAPGNPLPAAVPAAGIITKWKVNTISFPGTGTEKLKVVRPTGTPNQFTVVGETPFGTITGGPTTFAARLPVQAGDHIGVYGIAATPGVIYCNTGQPADVAGQLGGDPALNSTPTFAPANGVAPAVTATVEADADGDGFGDETQDLCPRSAAVHEIACPIVDFGTVLVPGTKSTLFIVTTTFESPVTVTGQVKLPKGGGKGGKPRAGKTITLKGGTKTVGPAKLVTFTLRYPNALKQALATGKALKLKATATTTTVVGDTFTKTDTAKLK